MVPFEIKLWRGFPFAFHSNFGRKPTFTVLSHTLPSSEDEIVGILWRCL